LEKQATAGVAVIVNGDDALRSLSATIVATHKQVGNADAKCAANGVNRAASKTLEQNAVVTFGHGQACLIIVVGWAMSLPLTIGPFLRLAAFGFQQGDEILEGHLTSRLPDFGAKKRPSQRERT
jgi:hypothetical protein